MNAPIILDSLNRVVDSEIARAEYPDGFPMLPEMPSGRYYDPDFYELEMEHVWRKSWLYAAHASELPELGSYRLFEQFGNSVIISRGTDNVIRAFKNTCRHRGAALTTKQCGVAKRFVCPYHSWSYAMDGRLQAVPQAHNFKDLDKSDRGLFEVRCESWRGFIYINFDENAVSLDEYMKPVTRQSADFPLEDMVVKDAIRFELDCNWKTAYDNFLESYHVSTVHTKTIAPFVDSRSFTVSLFENGHGRFVTRTKRWLSFADDSVDNQSRDDFDKRFKEYAIGLPFFPNGFTALDPVGFSWLTFWPDGPNKTVMFATMMGWKRDEDADREFWINMRGNMERVLREDMELFGSIQRSMEQGDLPGILLGYQERQIYWYNEEIDRRIGIENVPEHLRVKQVLARHTES